MQTHRTVSRVVGILEAVSRSSRGASITELCAALDAPRSTVHGFVRGLVAEGYLKEDRGTGRYTMALGAHALLASGGTSLQDVLGPVLARIFEEFNETVTLTVPLGRDIAYVSTLLPRKSIVYSPELHRRRAPWPASAGKVLLGFGALDSDDRFPGDAAARDELENAPSVGFCLNVGETVADVAAVAAPVFIKGRVVAAVSVGGPRGRMEADLSATGVRLVDLIERHGFGREECTSTD